VRPRPRIRSLQPYGPYRGLRSTTKEGARVVERRRLASALDPWFELALGSDPFRIDPEPPVHRAPAHLEWSRVRPCDELVGVLGVDTHQQSALAAGRDRHVAADEEGETSEHLRLRDVWGVGDQLA
jgi:hypothetical protein